MIANIWYDLVVNPKFVDCWHLHYIGRCFETSLSNRMPRHSSQSVLWKQIQKRKRSWIHVIIFLGLEEGDARIWALLFVSNLSSSRRCPGSDLVDCTVWLLLATMIATVDISMPLDKNGSAIEPQLDFDNLFFRYALRSLWNLILKDIRTPNPFKFSVTLRSHLIDQT